MNARPKWYEQIDPILGTSGGDFIVLFSASSMAMAGQSDLHFNQTILGLPTFSFQDTDFRTYELIGKKLKKILSATGSQNQIQPKTSLF